jgi:hypothetical protein
MENPSGGLSRTEKSEQARSRKVTSEEAMWSAAKKYEQKNTRWTEIWELDQLPKLRRSLRSRTETNKNETASGENLSGEPQLGKTE